MISNIKLVESTYDHVHELAQTMRQKDKIECVRFGCQPDKALFYSFKNAVIRRTGLVNNRVAAMWGVVGTPLSFNGTPYLLTSPEIEKIPALTFARIYKKEVEAMAKVFPILENYVDFEYKEAIKLLKIVGFEIDTLNCYTNSGHKFYRFTYQ